MSVFLPSGEFPDIPGKLHVRRLAVQGGVATVLASALGMAVQIGGTLVLVRLLTPADFGLVAMVTTFSLLLSNFGLNGFTESVVQRRGMQKGLASNLFWINLAVGVVLALGFAAAGPLLARFYRNPRLIGIAAAMSLTILFTSASVLHLSLLKRAMRFPSVSANDLAGRVVWAAICILLAYAGWGYRALVGGAVAQTMAQAAGAWALCRWTPGWPRRVADTGSMVRFALHVYGRFAVSYCTRNMDNLVVGYRFDARSLGFYNKAYDLFAVSAVQLVAPLTTVAAAALSRLDPHSPEYRRYLLNSIQILALVGMGLSADLTLVGADLIRVLLGPAWGEAGRIFTSFGPGIGILAIYGVHGWIHLSLGKPQRWFRWSIVECVVTTSLFLACSRWGPAGVAMAWTISFWLLSIPAFRYAGSPVGLRVADVIAVVWKSLASALAAGGACAGAMRGFPSLFDVTGLPDSTAWSACFRIGSVSLAFGLLYVISIVLLHRGWTPLRQLAALARELLPTQRAGQRENVPAAI